MTGATKWCPRCEDHRPIAEFYRNKGRPDGLSPLCAAHQRAAEAESIRQYRLRVIELLGGRCERCGYDADSRALQIDHRQGGGRAERLTLGAQRKFYKAVLANPAPYALLCANCNQIKRMVEREHGARVYERTVPTEKLQGIGRGHAPAQRAATDNWHANATPEQKAARKDKIAASRKGSKLVNGHWVRPEAPAAS